MKNIMRAQLLQLRKDKMIRFIFIGILAVSAMIVWMLVDSIPADSMLTGGEEAVFGLNMFQLLAQFFLFLFTAQACGADFMDKTCNYDIMSGHTRREVFFGRAIPAVIIGTLGTMLLIALPVVFQVVLLGGWGDKVSFADMLMRFLLMAFPIARVICEFIFLTFIIKNPYIVMGISYVSCLLLGMNVPVTTDHCFVLGMSNMNYITIIDQWSSFGLGGDLFYIYETGITAELAVPTILVSLIIGAAALLLGYTFFKNDDMH